MYLFGCRWEAPNHVRRTLVSTRPDACAPRKHRCGLPQVATLRYRGKRSRQLRPRPAGTRVRCAAQTCSTSFGIVVAAARMLTVRSSADTRINSTREVSWTTSWENPAQGLCVCSTDANRPILSRHTHKHSTRKVSWTTSREKPAQGLWMAETRVEDQTALRTQNQHSKICTTLFADRHQCLEIVPPNAVHRAVSYRMCSQEPR